MPFVYRFGFVTFETTEEAQNALRQVCIVNLQKKKVLYDIAIQFFFCICDITRLLMIMLSCYIHCGFTSVCTMISILQLNLLAQ